MHCTVILTTNCIFAELWGDDKNKGTEAWCNDDKEGIENVKVIENNEVNVKSFKCNECGKLCRKSKDIKYHKFVKHPVQPNI